MTRAQAEAETRSVGGKPAAPRFAGPEAAFWVTLLVLAVIWPLLVFAHPYGQDTPNHLARAYVLMHASDPLLAQHLSVAWMPVPNLAWDLFAVGVGQWLPLELALRSFVLMGVLLAIAGLFVLSRVTVGRWTLVPLLGLPFLFNSGYTKGFLSFEFSIGIVLLAAAWWRHAAPQRWLRRLVVATVLATMLFFAHFESFAIYGVYVLGLEIARFRAERKSDPDAPMGPWFLRLFRDGLQAVPALVIVLILPLFGTESVGFRAMAGVWHWPWRRFAELWRLIDVGTVVPSIGFLLAVAVLFGVLFRRRMLGFVRPPLVALTIFAVIYFIIPDSISATQFVAWRIALGTVLFLIAALVPTDKMTRRAMRFSLAATFLILVGLSGWQAGSFAKVEAERADYHALIADVPEGSAMAVFHLTDSNDQIEYDRIGLYHMSTEAVVARRITVQNLFTDPGQQPLQYRDPGLAGDPFLVSAVKRVLKAGLTWPDYLGQFQWVVLRGDETHPIGNTPVPGFRPVTRKGSFALYCRLPVPDRPGTCS